MFFFVSLKSENKTLNSLMKVPLFGPLMVAFFSLLPLVLVGALGDLAENLTIEIALIVGSILCVPWNYYLKIKNTVIHIMKIPAWMWAIISLILILLGGVS